MSWQNDYKDSWFDDSTEDTSTFSRSITVICVKNEINGNTGTCRDIDECDLDPCGYGSCSNYPGGFNCTCPDEFLQGEGNQQCRTCDTGFELENELGKCKDVDE